MTVTTRPPETVAAEFRRQVDNLVGRGYPELAGLETAAFVELLEPLGRQLDDVPADTPFTLVVSSAVVPSHLAITAVRRDTKNGFTTMDADDLARFRPVTEDMPSGPAHLLLDVDPGAELLNQPPEQALPRIQAAGRFPLTIEEGIAVVTQREDAIAPGRCFSLAGSRCGDRRVPALWLSAGRPRLGWCWAGAPHTWLGTASGGRRKD